MPTGATGDAVVKTVTSPDAPVSFGDISYNAIGTYHYHITEDFPLTSWIDGMSYSHEEWTATVTVTANTKHDKLVATTSMEQTKNASGATINADAKDDTDAKPKTRANSGGDTATITNTYDSTGASTG